MDRRDYEGKRVLIIGRGEWSPLLVRVVTATVVWLQAMPGLRLPITLSAMPRTSTWPPGILN